MSAMLPAFIFNPTASWPVFDIDLSFALDEVRRLELACEQPPRIFRRALHAFRLYGPYLALLFDPTDPASSLAVVPTRCRSD